MACNLNIITIAGRLTDAPTLKTITERSVCEFSVAVNRVYTTKEGRKSSVTFVPCTAWGKTADTIAQYFTKGQGILVSGRLEIDHGTDGRMYPKVIIDSFEFTTDQVTKAKETVEAVGEESQP
jgi:single-strand DNA-binding protein